jgi:hypothetical protein
VNALRHLGRLVLDDNLAVGLSVNEAFEIEFEFVFSGFRARPAVSVVAVVFVLPL